MIETVTYPLLASPEDLADTVREVEKLDARIVARQGDVRDREALGAVVKEGLAEFGRLDIVVANAGVLTIFDEVSSEPRAFDEVVTVNLTGVYTIEAALPWMLEAGPGGAASCSPAPWRACTGG